MADRNWRRDAICRDEDPTIFDGTGGYTADTMQALRVCHVCPAAVKQACLNDALATGDLWTVRGGMTGDERDTERSRRAKAAAAERMRRNRAAAKDNEQVPA